MIAITNFTLTKTNHIIISASINGTNGTFIIDTGANSTCVSAETAASFNVTNHTGNIAASGISSNVQCFKSYNNILKIGNNQIEVDIYVMDLKHINKKMDDGGADGYIGSEINNRLVAKVVAAVGI